MSLSFLNCVNEALIFVIRQESIRRSVLEFILYGTPNFLQKKILHRLNGNNNCSPLQSIFKMVSGQNEIRKTLSKTRLS